MTSPRRIHSIERKDHARQCAWNRIAMIACIAFLIAAHPRICLSATVTGTIKPANADVSIVLYDENGSADRDALPPQATIDAKTGKFTFAGVKPGSYDLSVQTDFIHLLPKAIDGLKVGSEDVDVGLLELQMCAWITGKIDPPGETYVWMDKSRSNTEGGYVEQGEGGEFTFDGLVPGKAHKLTFERKNFEDYTLDVNTPSAREYKVGTIKLRPRARITGRITITGKVPTDLKYTQVGAVRLEDPPIEGRTRFVQGTVSVAKPGIIDYTLSDVRAGHYDISICSSAFLVIGMHGLPTRGASSRADEKKVKERITSLIGLFTRGDEARAKKLVDPSCTFHLMRPHSDLHDFLAGEKKQLANIDQRSFLIVRAGRDRAQAYTRAAMTPLGEEFEGWPNGLKADLVEHWCLKRAGSQWKLTTYESDSDVTSVLAIERAQAWGWGKPSGRPSKSDIPFAQVIMTDDPKFANVEIKSGEISARHDVALKLP